MEYSGLISWSARLAGMALAARWLALLLWPDPPRANRAVRAGTLAAAILLALHLLLAFHFRHQWSHQAATEHIARVTARATGVYWGGGIWFNYATLLLLVLEAARLSRHALLLQRRTCAAFLAIDGWLAFMFFSATVLFAPAPGRWLSLAVWVLLVVLVATRGIRGCVRRGIPRGRPPEGRTGTGA